MASTNEHSSPSSPDIDMPLREQNKDELDDDLGSEVEKDPSWIDDSFTPSKKRARCGTSSQPRPKRVKGKQGALKGLMRLPIETFTEIASYLAPVDLVTLSWSNKFFRELLLRRSSSTLWKWAQSNVPGLPPCPVTMSEPQYAVLMFAKYCTLCGASATARPDPHWHARLCALCRNSKVTQLQPWKIPKLVDETLVLKSAGIGMKLKVARRWRSFPPNFALQTEIDEVLRTQQEFRDAGDTRGLEKWEEGKRELVLEMMKHGHELHRYLESTNKTRLEGLDEIKCQRRNTIIERMRVFGWTDEDFKLDFSGCKQWRSLVEVSKPLTDRIWQNLLPKLVPLLEDNRRKMDDYKTRERRTKRRLCVHEFISQKMRIEHPLEQVIKTLRLELPEGTHSSGDSDPLCDYRLDRLLPQSGFALTWDSLVDLSERDITIEQVKMELEEREERLRGKIQEWRDRVEKQLVENFYGGSENIIDEMDIVIKGSKDLGVALSPHQRLLLRADTVFEFTKADFEFDEYWRIDTKQQKPHYYPQAVTMLYIKFLEHTPRDIPETPPKVPQDISLGRLQRNSLVEGIVKALLKDLGMPDATRMELLALPFQFICGRCIDYTPRTWDGMVAHYVSAPKMWEQSRSTALSTKRPVVYRNVHDHDSTHSSKPLVRLLTKDEALDVGTRKPAYNDCDPVCYVCRATNLSFGRFGSTPDVISHLEDVHEISEPIDQEHYGRVASLDSSAWLARWDQSHNA